MPDVTAKLGLKKPLGNETFNRQSYNENLDLIDQNVETSTSAQAKADAAEIAAKAYTDQEVGIVRNDVDAHLAETTTPQYSTPVTETSSVISLPSNTVKGQINASVKGRTIANIETDGDCEDTSKFTGSYATLALDSTDKISGSNSIKVTTTQNGACAVVSNAYSIDNTKYYLITGYSKINQATDVLFSVRKGSDTTGLKYANTHTSTTFKRDGIKLSPTEIGAETSLKLYFGFTTTTTGQIAGNIDGLMLTEITTDEYNNLTVDELLAKYPFVNDVNSTFSDSGDSIKSVGKNLVPPFSEWNIHTNHSIDESGTLINNSIINTDVSWIRIKVKPNTQYRRSAVFTGTAKIQISKIEVDGTFGATIAYEDNFITPSDIDTVEIRHWKDDGSSASVTDLQIEEGDTVTEYEPYQESVIYPPVLRSLPNGVKDEINEDGDLIKRVSDEFTLNGSHIALLDTTTYTNVDIVGTAQNFNINVLSAKTWTTAIDGQVDVYGRYETDVASIDSLSSIGRFYTTDSGRIVFIVTKSTYADLASAQTAWNNSPDTLIYQLAEPVITEGAITPLTCFENGTLIVNSTVLPEITWSVPINTKAQIDSNTEGINTLSKKVNAIPKITVSDTSPSDPKEGDIWIDTSA